ncbi:MAG: class I SAM-dependent methyltransferase [Bryobacterales bacterium]|nr:class I SAM-dependent methyltransferase [Bryobacterales bacterium]
MDWLKRIKRSKDARIQANPELATEIRRSFEAAASDEAHFPSVIDERIQHVRVVIEHMRTASTGVILDVGSGKGRFAAVVKRHYPQAHVVAFDLAGAMLASAPASLSRVCGSMLEIPFASSSVSGALAIESLEHAVDIDRALDEICRVLKPGGHLVIIDKNAEHWGRLQTPHWEKWFHRADLEDRLRKRCSSVSSRLISYWDDVEPDGLFLGWFAVK